jgi:hypothetical protein
MTKPRNVLLRTLPLVLSLAIASSAFAGNRSGTVTAQFLKLPVNARAAAMGNAQVSLAEGATSMGYNPAGILNTKQFAFGATYNQWWADITHSFMGVSANLNDLGMIGIGAVILSTDEMAVTSPAFPEGTGETFRASEYAFTVTYARQISEEFGLGLSAKYIKSNLYNKDIDASAIAFDIGSLYDIPLLRTRLGISVTNLGRDLKYINEQYSLPTTLRFGARTQVFQSENHALFTAVQVGRPNDADEQYNAGIEYVFQNLVSFRTGYRFNYDTENWSGGLGISLASVGLDGRLDYAYTNYEFLPGTHMFSMEIGF